MKCLQLMLPNFHEINKKNRNGQSLLHCAVTHGTNCSVEILIKHGADLNVRDEKTGWANIC